MSNTNRLYLLSEAEITDLYARPNFNSTEKELYFTLNNHELDALNHYSYTRTRVYFILQLGYFKAKQQFFQFKFEEVPTNIEYILFNFFDDTEASLSGRISRDYLNLQKLDILNRKCNKKSDDRNINSEISPHDNMPQMSHKHSVF